MSIRRWHPAARTESIQLPSTRQWTSKHPAKMHSGLALRLIKDYSEPGWLVADVFAGSGTTLAIASQLQRRCVGVEIEQNFVASSNKFGSCVQASATRLPIDSDCVDFVLTSPPYGEAIGRSGDRSLAKTIAAKARYETKRFGSPISEHPTYGFHPLNIGSLPLSRTDSSCFVSLMPMVVSEIMRILKPGRIAAIVVKDQRLGRRSLGSFDLPGNIVKWGIDAGAIFYGRRYGLLPRECFTLWQRVNQERWGQPIPDIEQVILLRKRGVAVIVRRRYDIMSGFTHGR